MFQCSCQSLKNSFVLFISFQTSIDLNCLAIKFFNPLLNGFSFVVKIISICESLEHILFLKFQVNNPCDRDNLFLKSSGLLQIKREAINEEACGLVNSVGHLPGQDV